MATWKTRTAASPWAALLVLAGATGALAKPVEGLHYQLPPSSGGERPYLTAVTGQPESTGYALALTFNKPPLNKDCGSDCTNATLFLDTDNNTSTGLKLSPSAVETGADVAVNFQDIDGRLKIRVRLLSGATQESPEGETLEADVQRDESHLQVSGTHVSVSIEMSDPRIPKGPRLRIAYHPPAGPPAQALLPGLIAKGNRRIHFIPVKPIKSRKHP